MTLHGMFHKKQTNVGRCKLWKGFMLWCKESELCFKKPLQNIQFIYILQKFHNQFKVELLLASILSYSIKLELLLLDPTNSESLLLKMKRGSVTIVEIVGPKNSIFAQNPHFLDFGKWRKEVVSGLWSGLVSPDCITLNVTLLCLEKELFAVAVHVYPDVTLCLYSLPSLSLSS